MKKILIIEDDLLIGKMLEFRLAQKKEYDLRRALDGEEGIKAVKEFVPDCVILDLAMPKKNGFDVLEEIKPGRKEGSGPHIIILSNLSEDKDMKRALDLGGHVYFVKNKVSIDEVVQYIAKIFT